jgi:hypothetical protein
MNALAEVGDPDQTDLRGAYARLRATQDRISSTRDCRVTPTSRSSTTCRTSARFSMATSRRTRPPLIGPATAKAQRDAKVVKERIDVVIADLDAVHRASGAAPAGIER